jgi:hypothetical protein
MKMRRDGDGGGRNWRLQGWDHDRGTSTIVEFYGWLLAEESSHAVQHDRLIHPPNDFAAQGDRCSACRWFEVRIYEKALPAEASEDEVAGWVVETVGQTVVPGEVVRRQVRTTTEPRHVISALVQQKEGQSFIPIISRKVLDRAAKHDELLADAIEDVLVPK